MKTITSPKSHKSTLMTAAHAKFTGKAGRCYAAPVSGELERVQSPAHKRPIFS